MTDNTLLISTDDNKSVESYGTSGTPADNGVYIDFQRIEAENRQLENKTRQIGNATLEDNKTARKILICVLCCVSIAWLIFTAIIIVWMGSECSRYRLVSGVAIAFITTSLGTVLGLWAIGLQYFFHR